jgi:hypothetical protein
VWGISLDILEFLFPVTYRIMVDASSYKYQRLANDETGLAQPKAR